MKDLIRLNQVNSVVHPSTAVWIVGSSESLGTFVDQGISGNMEGSNGEGRFTRFEVVMLIAVILLIVPHALNAVTT